MVAARHHHGPAAFPTKYLSCKQILVLGRVASALVLPACHTRLNLLPKLLIYDPGNSVLNHQTPLGGAAVAVPLCAAMRPRHRAVYQTPDVRLVFQDIVQTVFAEWAPAFGGTAFGGQCCEDLSIAGAGGVHREDLPHCFGFPGIDDIAPIGVHIIAQGRSAAASAALAGHESHLLHDLLAGDQDMHLVEEGQCPLVDEDGWVQQIAANQRLRHAYHPRAQGLQLPAEGEPLHHVPKHPALVVDHHRVGPGPGPVQVHHPVVLRAVLLHAGHRFVAEDIQHRELVLTAVLGAFLHLYGSCVRILVVRAVSGEDESCEHKNTFLWACRREVPDNHDVNMDAL